MTSFHRWLCAGGLAIATIASASASVSTLGTSVDGGDRASYNQWLAMSFELDAGADDVTVGSVSMRVRSLTANANVYVAITSSESQRPLMEDVLVIFDTSELANAVSMPTSTLFTMDPELDQDSPAPILTAGALYWLVFGITDLDHDQDLPGGLYEWDYTTASSPFEENDGLSVGGLIATGDTGGQDWDPVAASPYHFSVDIAPPIPEPGVAAMSVLAGIVLLARRSRRTQR